MTGFLEESKGVRSSTRLFGLILIILTAVLVCTIAGYVFLLREKASATVIGAIVGGVTALVAQGAVAISKRNPADSSTS